MSQEAVTGEAAGADNDADGDVDGGPERRLVGIYRQYIGEPDSRRDVYAGFGLFFAGVALGVVGLIVFLASGTQPTGSTAFWTLREGALVAAMVALPATVLSIAVLLPVGRRTTGVGAAGAALCLAATAWLTQVYPFAWTAAGNDISVIGTYAVGVVLLAAATGSALVAQYVDRVAPRETAKAAEADGDADEPGVTDEEVAEDIESAMSESTLTWGGVDQQPTTKRLELDMPEPDQEIDSASVDSATETRAGSDDVDDAVAGLRQLQGGERETARAESPDEQVDALTEFRRQQETAEDVETGVEEPGLLTRLRERLFGK